MIRNIQGKNRLINCNLHTTCKILTQETLSRDQAAFEKSGGLEMVKAKVVEFELSIIGKHLNLKSGC